MWWFIEAERKGVKSSMHMGGGSEGLSAWGSVSSGYYKDFISWLKENWLCLCAVGPLRGCMSSPASVFQGVTGPALFRFPMSLRSAILAGHLFRIFCWDCTCSPPFSRFRITLLLSLHNLSDFPCGICGIGFCSFGQIHSLLCLLSPWNSKIASPLSWTLLTFC
jgi:hypothetical protein